MRTIKLLTTSAITLLFIFSINHGFAQKTKNIEEVKIKASMKCGSCKAKIEKNIPFEKGVKELSVDLETKTVTIKYITDKTNPENLVSALEKLGFEAKIITEEEEIKKEDVKDKKKNSKSDYEQEEEKRHRCF